MKKWLALGLISIGCVIGSPLQVVHATAPTSASPVGITLTPFLETVTVASFESIKSLPLLVVNHTQSMRTFNVEVADFNAQGEFGGVAFLGRTDPSHLSRHGLVKWLSVSQTSFSLAANASTTLMVSVRNDATLSPGGHYGAVLVNEVTGASQQLPNRVGANPTVSSLFFVTKLGGEQYDLRLNQTTYDASWRHLPMEAHVRFQNPGNVAVVPRGTVRLLGPHNTLLGQGAINEDSSFILPDAYRQLVVPIKLIGTAAWWPARYTLQVNYRYDGLAQAARHEESFYFINWLHIGLSLGLFSAIAVALYYYHRVLWITLKKVRFHS